MDKCKYCGAEIDENASTGSLHIWKTQYLCGASIIGAIGSDEQGIEEDECPNKNMKEFDKEDLDFYLPKSFKGLSKKYLMDCMFDEKIQKNWKPTVGDIIVGCTGNVFVISAYHKTHEDMGGDKFFFGGGLCNRGGGILLNETYSSVLNEDGMEYYHGTKGFEKRDNPYYSKFSDFRYVPYPHEETRNICTIEYM